MTFQTATPLDVRTIDSNGVVPLGYFNHPKSLEIQYITVHMLKVGTAVGNESLKLRVHSSENLNVSYLQSSSKLLSDFSTEENFLGWLRFDFDRQNLVAGQTYHLTLKAENYTRDGDNFYLAVVYDTPFSVNSHTDANVANINLPKAFKLIGYL